MTEHPADYTNVKDRLEAHRKAVEVAQQLLDTAESPQTTLAEKEYYIGLALYQLEEYPIASEHLLASFRLQEQAETAARLSVCHWRMKELDAAKKWINRALMLDPKGSIETLIAKTRPSFYGILAELHLSAGEIEAAAVAARGALAQDPNDITALHVLASTHLVSGDASAAMAMYDQAVKVAPPFIQKRLVGEQQIARKLLDANVRLAPFVTEAASIARVVI